VATGPWEPGSARFLASDADRERVVDVLKTAFVHGTMTRDELTLRTGRALTARTYTELAVITAGLTPGAPPPAPRPARQPRRRRVSKKVVAWSACAVVLLPALSVAFLTYYGGFLVMMLFSFTGAALLSKPPASPPSHLAKSMGGKH
jgi:nitrate reductase NapE component